MSKELLEKPGMTLWEFLDREPEKELGGPDDIKGMRCPVCNSVDSARISNHISYGYMAYLYCHRCHKRLFTVIGMNKNDVFNKFTDHYKYVKQNGIPATIDSRNI